MEKKRKIKSRFIMQGLAVRILSGALPAEQITICTGEYSIFGSITYISLQAADVSRRMIGVNFFVCLALFLFMLLLRKSGTPLAIFALFAVLTHMISCVFFWLAGEYFPYTLVAFYAIFINKKTKDYEYGKKRSAWKWS